jgi:cobalamin-dependent methionine synthase I
VNWTAFFIAWSVMATVLAIRESYMGQMYKRRYESERVRLLELIAEMQKASDDIKRTPPRISG